jgi:diguanylate cyclase (GGDEF)-like protein
MSYDIFRNEEAILREANENLQGDRLRDPADRELYSNIVNAYQDLFKVARRLVRIGDQLTGDVRESSSIDSLTRVLNRRRFQQLADIELGRARRYRHAIALLVMDLDHFKLINDTYGHLTGDAVLRDTAKTLHDTLREIDKLGRWGGEEFVALLPETDRMGATILAERLCRSVEQTTIKHDGHSISCTISIGVAVTEQAPDELDEIVGLADQALYRAKGAGRNQIACSWDDAS